jgi:hypothetical protein
MIYKSWHIRIPQSHNNIRGTGISTTPCDWHFQLAQQFAMDVEYSQDVVFDWGDLLLLLNEGTFKLIQ